MVSAKVPFGIQYSVVAGSWINYITPATKTFTAGLVLREVSMEWEFDNKSVDLGLPSGTKWAKFNIDITQPDGFATSEFEGNYYCSFFSWGNIVGHNPISDTKFDYDFGNSNTGPYSQTTGSQLTGNIPVNSTYDAARAWCGVPWRMPTATEFQELIDNCTITSVENNSKPYHKFTSNINGKYIYFPLNGNGMNDDFRAQGACWHWGSTLYENGTYGYCISNKSVGATWRYYGMPIRPVQ